MSVESTIERELPDEQAQIDDDVGHDPDSSVLATLDEEQAVAVQLQKIEEYTIQPGLMRLPVSEVTSAENSDNMVVVLNHPVEDDIRKYFAKPPYWSTEYELPALLDAYGYRTNNPYHLQRDRLYVEYDDDDEEWVIIGPPADWKRTLYRAKKQISKRVEQRVPGPIRYLVGECGRRFRWIVPRGSYGALLGFTILGLVAGTIVSMFGITIGSGPMSMSVIQTQLIGLMIGLSAGFFLVPPPNGGGRS